MLKSAKKVFLVLLLCCIAIGLVACVGSSSLLYRGSLKPKTLELIYYDNPNAIESPSEKSAFDLGLLRVLEEFDLGSIENDNFGQEFNIRVHQRMNRKQFLFAHNGIGLRMIYEDKSFQIITLTEINGNHRFFVSVYSEDGTQMESHDAEGSGLKETFMAIINKHFSKHL